MATYVLMTKLTPEITRDIKHREKIGKKWMQKVSEKCPEVKWIAHYALLGPYDFMDIFEAPNEEIAAKVSIITLSSGALQAESWTAIPYSRFLDLVEEV
ncbi:MAG: GYD domain-containing protein [Candidatus Latescibacteria bacterium]|nr:GYD domain-containing protein [Candidatus Latescibacterota bacterium]NIM21782.1 GYD domain-containing protein [Candidatus Latescibacterota bacterium]NIM65920.1 GYD domain-containing protein [Candidatus Latescibacterota bacterium]NIO02665.1 GYD domain-containing protein [Candidatus Latescibacterota bacterium]NIO29646.1 GYD domain-containing protein [Candidatus Latescibacterota bacterium]